MSMKVSFDKGWNGEQDFKKNEILVVDKKYCANTWETTLGQLYIPKVYHVPPEAKKVSFQEWIKIPMSQKVEDKGGLKLDKAVINIVDRSVCKL